MKKCALLALVLCAFALPARATTFSTDVSDLWWNASESGWGLNVIHQGDILFLTFFVYGESNQATWYSGSETRYQSTLGNGSIVYSGPLHLTGGSWLGAPWNASAVNYRQVGNVTFTLTSVTTASLTYTVDGVSVSKQLTRLTWRNNDLAGAYLGASLGTYTAAPPSAGTSRKRRSSPLARAPAQ